MDLLMAVVHGLLLTAYTVALIWLALWGLQSILLALISHIQRRQAVPPVAAPATWPRVTIQLPIYNERYVVERAIEALVSQDYPRDRLQIQILDDSTDETVELVARLVRGFAAAGIDIQHLRRASRAGFKGGALAAAFAQASGEMIAVFDADFVPAPDFLRRTVPYLVAQPSVGCVQARWGHHNSAASLLTQAQELQLDTYFVVEELTRSRSGLIVRFAGSAGVWRKSAIRSAGGWQGDTLTEDADLSYRAYLCGWRIVLLPDLVVPGELPAQLAAVRQQEYRWARGLTQTGRKVIVPLWRSRLPLLTKIEGTLQVFFFTSSLMMLVLIFAWPLLLLTGAALPDYSLISIFAVLGQPFLYMSSARRLRGKWSPGVRRSLGLLLLGIGLAANNSCGVLAGLFRQTGIFRRTPKLGESGPEPARRLLKTAYRLRADRSLLCELLVGCYTLISFFVALALGYYQMLFWLALYTVSFWFVVATVIWQDWDYAGAAQLAGAAGPPERRSDATTAPVSGGER